MNITSTQTGSYPKVSVFVPTYNHEQFIADCLDSILAQNYSNLEIVCGDDASNDGTPEILKNYKERYPKVIKIFLNKTNLGVTKNCNNLLAQCEGKYIALFAGDDLMLPGKLKKQVELLEHTPNCVLCYHNLDVFDSLTNKTLYYYNNSTVKPYEGKADLLLKHQVFTGPPSIMIRSSAIPQGGYNEEISTVSDWLFFIEVANKGEIRYINETLARYRRHKGSITYSNKYYKEVYDSFNIIRGKYPKLAKYIYLSEGAICFQQAGDRLKEGDMEGFYEFVYKAFKNRYRLTISIPLVLLKFLRKVGCLCIIDKIVKKVFSLRNSLRDSKVN
ncbi:glycosyltransferase [Holosporaceae bacterium 'Namur']|nr:glycosyltransferase [Holosporaceae bacterium 'Namur']